MKKKFLLSLIFFFLCVKFYTFNVHAFQPPVLPSDTSFVESWLVSLAQYELANRGVKVDDVRGISSILNGRTVNDSITFEYTDLSTVNWSVGNPLWDSSGNLVLQENAIMAKCTSDVGNTVFLYSAENGEILRQGETFETSSTTVLGGIESIVDMGTSRFPLTDPVGRLAPENNYCFTPNTVSDEIKEHLENYEYSGYMRSNNQNFVCFVPNGCSASCRLLPSGGNFEMEWSGANDYSGVYSLDIVCNDIDDVVFVGSGGYAYLQHTLRNYGGYTYQYTQGWYNIFNVMINGGEVKYKAPTNEVYNQIMNSGAIYVAPTEPTINNNYYYNYDKFISDPPVYNKTINNYYDYSQPITEYNYPYDTSVSSADYTPSVNNYYQNYYTYETSPQVGEDVSSVPEEVPDNIPIISNLQKRFPFSIPFDIYNILNGLSVARETPHLEYSIDFPIIDYVWNIDIDLSAWDSIAELFRLLFLILFIIGLALFSYSHFFGS